MSINHDASEVGPKDPLGSVIVTVEPTQSSRTTHSVTNPTSCSTTSLTAPRVPAGAKTTCTCSTAGRCPIRATRWQPEGMRGPVARLDTAFAWTDDGFAPPALRDARALRAACRHVHARGHLRRGDPAPARLRELGVTAIELMPVAEFPGRHGWGYDGVYISAAHSPTAARTACSGSSTPRTRVGLAVCSTSSTTTSAPPATQALEAFGPYFTDKYETFWGEAMNYDDAGSDAVREWALQSAEGWVRDFHVDGLRLDAIHAIFDDERRAPRRGGRRRVHAARAGALVIAESGLNDPKVMRPVSAAAGAATPPGPTTSTTRCGSC